MDIRPKNRSDYIYRFSILYALLSFLTIAIIIRLFQLQIINGEKYKNKALNNRQQILYTPAHRGEIRLKNETKVVKNSLSFSLYINPINLKGYKKDKILFQSNLNLIIKDFDLNSNTVKRILKRSAKNPYQSYLLKQDVEFKKIIKLSENLEQYSGLIYHQTPLRSYFYNDMYSHITGYINKINENQMKSLNRENYHSESFIGVSGIEKYYDKEIRGKDGKKNTIN